MPVLIWHTYVSADPSEASTSQASPSLPRLPPNPHSSLQRNHLGLVQQFYLLLFQPSSSFWLLLFPLPRPYHILQRLLLSFSYCHGPRPSQASASRLLN